MKKVLLTTFALFAILTQSAYAAFTTDKMFGGKSYSVQFCTCSATIMISLDNVESKSLEYFIYDPMSTELYKNFLYMMSGVYMLGTAELMTTECQMVSGNSCVVVGTGYPIKMLGTSLPF